MGRIWRFVPAVCAAVVLSACATGTGGLARPVDTGGSATSPSSGPSSAAAAAVDGATTTFRWNTGALPPPYSHSWVVTLQGTAGTLTFRADGRGAPSWSAPFTVDAARAAGYRSAMAGEVSGGTDTDDDYLAGGSTGSYKMVLADGTRWQGKLGGNDATRALLDRLEEQSKALVPADVWSGVEGRYTAWQKTAPR
ncbi:hypothetical protein [Nakamurella endophytica]|uniref:Lipoprotein n=1 Tax=Nakamurella endophytica TaxID=1748367 RepID=A0A917SKY2_9ACTN|nr:hypothetical protein [Nakamurella endophytica]GGL87634.1 hypothetical protein GCM10011594_04090 [Nakamurella endophytica]